MNKEVLNKSKFAAAVRTKRGNIALRDAAALIGKAKGKISAATLSRVEQGKAPDVDTFLRLCSWLDTPPSEFAELPEKTGEAKARPTMEVIETHLRADKTLTDETTNALVEMMRLAYRNTE